MAIRLTSTKKSASHVKALGYGDAGVGKTVLCSTAPSPIIISAEAGLMSISDYDIPVIEIKTVEDAKDAYRFITEAKEANNFETVCLDSITEIAQVLLAQYKMEEKDPRQAYGRTIDDMGSLIRQFRDLQGKHVYFTAKMTRLEDDYTGISTFKPMMPSKGLVNDLPFFFDEVMALRIGIADDKSTYRYIQTQSDIQYIAKDRSGKLDAMERPDLTYLFNKILSKKPMHEHQEGIPAHDGKQEAESE